jgi:hypothetical protein
MEPGDPSRRFVPNDQEDTMPTVPLTRAAVLALALAIAAFDAGAATTAEGKRLLDCATTQACTWRMVVDGTEVLSGTFGSGPSGELFVPQQKTRWEGSGGFVQVNGLSGNIDPILGFNVSSGTGATGLAFSFTFNLPIALEGPIDASSSVSYSLTSLSAAGAQVAPLLPGGKVVNALEVDTTVGGLLPLNKGVDAGERFFFVGGPQTQNSPVYTASSSFAGSFEYDLMSVVVAYSLSPNSQVGMSGFVQQLPIPEPATWAMLLAGAVGVRLAARRQPIR